MDVRLVSLSSLMFVTAWMTPRHSSTVDFRSTFRPLKISLNKASPAYAAIEAVRIDRPKARLVVQRDSLNSPPIQYVTLTTNRPQNKLFRFRPLVISSQTPNNEMSSLNATEIVSSPVVRPGPANMPLLEYARYLVQKELDRRRALQSGFQTIRTRFGSSIYVADAQKINPSQVLSSATLPSSKRYRISGSVTMTDGAGLVEGKQQFLIYHQVNGAEAERGSINMTTGRFRLNVESLSGEVVAEVRADNGDLIARGAVRLGPFKENAFNRPLVRNVNIYVAPDNPATVADVVAADPLDGHKFSVSNAKLVIGDLNRVIPYNHITHAYTDSLLIQPSNYMVSAYHPDDWPSIALAQSGEKFQVRLFSNDFLESFLNVTLPKLEASGAQRLGVIWGKVTMQGQPVEGASVNIVGDSAHTPVYFSGLIPDRARSTTSSSGEFAFSSLNPVVSAIQVSLGSKAFWPVLLPVAGHAVTYANLQIEPPHAVNFRAFDAFSKVAIGAVVSPLGSNKEFYVPEQGTRHTSVQTVRGMTLLEAKSDANYATVRCELRPHQADVSFPFIQNTWLNGMYAKSRLPHTQGPGVAVVFFVKGDDYDVTIGAGAPHPNQKVVYFNSRGQYSKYPVTNGGFVIFGLSPGFATITLDSVRAGRVVTKLVYADNYAVAVSHVNLGYSY